MGVSIRGGEIHETALEYEGLMAFGVHTGPCGRVKTRAGDRQDRCTYVRRQLQTQSVE